MTPQDKEAAEMLRNVFQRLINYCLKHGIENPSIKMEAQVPETGEKFTLSFERVDLDKSEK